MKNTDETRNSVFSARISMKAREGLKELAKKEGFIYGGEAKSGMILEKLGLGEYTLEPAITITENNDFINIGIKLLVEGITGSLAAIELKLSEQENLENGYIVKFQNSRQGEFMNYRFILRLNKKAEPSLILSKLYELKGKDLLKGYDESNRSIITEIIKEQLWNTRARMNSSLERNKNELFDEFQEEAIVKRLSSSISISISPQLKIVDQHNIAKIVTPHKVVIESIKIVNNNTILTFLIDRNSLDKHGIISKIRKNFPKNYKISQIDVEEFIKRDTNFYYHNSSVF